MKLISLMLHEFEKRRIKNPSYSLRAFSRDIDISHGHINQLLSGKKPFSLRVVRKILDILEINGSDKELIEKDFIAQDKVRQEIRTMFKDSSQNKQNKMPVGAIEYQKICHWSYDAIFHLIEGKVCAEDEIHRISQQLNFSVNYISECIAKLIEVKILMLNDNFLKKCCSSYYMKGGACEMNMKVLVNSYVDSQKELFNMGIEQFVENNNKDDLFTTQCCIISHQQIELIKELILSFSDKIVIVLQDSSKKQDVDHELYFFNTQFFSPLNSKN